MQHVEKEITKPVLLCQANGKLNPEAIGFARYPLIQSNLTKNFMRKKKWNYWCIYGEDVLFSVTISHLDYATVCFVYLLNFETQQFCEKQITIPLGKQAKMPEHVLESVSYSHSQMAIDMLYIKDETKLIVTIPNFDGEHLHAELDIYHPPGDESLNVVIPKSRRIYQFTAKHHILPTSGFVQLGMRKYAFKSDHSFAVLDYGRGIWEREAIWNWGMASQRIGNQRIGLNFGGRWTDGTGMTENAVFVDGKMFKIHEDVLFTYQDKNLKEPWHIQTKFSSDVQLTFTPFFQRTARTDVKIIRSSVQQLVGYYSGQIHLQNGQVLQIRKMLGCVEEHLTKW